MSEQRPNPEVMLERAKEEELQQYGKLKIYLGAAPGVGKTHRMLEDALARRSQGLDVVAGVVESHGRKEIESLLKKFEILPRKAIDYHGKPIFEFDLDGALNRQPGLILIDEMAHTNVPGMRHAKRWHDIKELLDRGIDIYTTLNVQHIESLNDVVEQIIGIKVRETVPDSVLEMADTIELVDLPPDELLKRLQEGKIYLSAQAELATQHFFRKGNLIALRELALRVVADAVDLQVLSHRRGQGIEQTWPTTERLLVCIGADINSAKVVRAARRMATGLHSEWIAIHVDAPKLYLTEAQRNEAIKNLRLAEQLGAETHILTAVDLVKEIIRFARDRNVTKIIVGKHISPRWRDFFHLSLVDELIRNSGEIDIYIIRGEIEKSKLPKLIPDIAFVPWTTYALAFLVTTIATGINFLIFPYAGLSNLIMVYLLGVIIVALQEKAGPSLLASFLSVAFYDFFFIAPRFSFNVSDLQYVFTLLIMLLVAQLISHLTILSKQQAEIYHMGEQRTGILYVLTRQLASARGVEKLLEIAVRHIFSVFNSDVVIYLPENNMLHMRAVSNVNKLVNEKDLGVAQWVFDMKQIAGLGTDTLPQSESVYLPLLGTKGSVGVLQVCPKIQNSILIPEQLHFLEVCTNQIALALEVDRLQTEAQKAEVDIDAEQMRAALFNSLSRELQRPLSTIVTSVHHLTDKKTTLEEETTRKITRTVTLEAERLNRLINTLLQITQLEEGKLKLDKKFYSLDEVIQLTVFRLEKKLRDKPCIIRLPIDMPLLSFDKMLMEQVFINLIKNAVAYTPINTPIEIAATVEDETVLLSVADRGPGLNPDDVEKIFEIFYRSKMSQKGRGVGLGLSVCQSIIKAHGGRIWAENRWDNGAIFYFILPINP